MKLDFSGKTIPEAVFTTCERFPNKVALMVNRGDGTFEEITYSQLMDKVVRLSSFIQRSGFEAGEHIAILGHNSPQWAIAYLAIQTAGCIAVPLDSAQRPNELRHILRHSDSSAIFLDKNFLNVLSDEVEDYFPDLPRFELQNIDIIIDTETSPKPPRFDKSQDNVAVIIYTSGTTGAPKGVMLTHKNILSDIDFMFRVITVTEKDTFLSVLPIHHSFEATCGFLAPLTIGCSIVYARALRAKEILEDIKAGGVTIMLGVPLLFEKFYSGIKKGVRKSGFIGRSIFGGAMGISKALKVFSKNSGKLIMKPFRNKAGMGGLNLLISGGAAIKPEVVKFFNNFGITCSQGYGLTETSPVVSVNPINKIKAESVGPPIPEVKVRIGNPNEEGIGEIQVKGPIVFAGYYKNEEATKEAFTDDGWFRTGDLGYIDKDGYIYITGRLKNMILTSGGKNVYPEEIEEKINSHDVVLESLVIGRKTKGGEEPFAIVVPNFDYIDEKYGSMSESQVEALIRGVIEDVNKKIAPYKRIKGFAIQTEEFPKTSTRKIKRYLYQAKEFRV